MSGMMSQNQRLGDGYDSGGWAGWHGFAAVLLFVVGLFNIMDGLVAVLKDEVVLGSGPRVTVLLDITAWGWIHLALGLVFVAAGIGIFLGQTWARLVGVVAVSVNMVTQVMNVPAYPVWSILIIALDVVIIWALTVHGHAMKNA
jgi:hypothetical protein